MAGKERIKHAVIEKLAVERDIAVAGSNLTDAITEAATLDGLTASAAELNFNDTAVAGTAVASKTLVLGANKNVDVLAVADLKLGAGAGTSVTSTAAELNILDGVTKTYSEINLLVAGVAGGYKIARGQHTTVAASDTVVTGLATVVAAVAVLDSDPTSDPLLVSCSIGDQSGAPAAGSIYIKTWKPTAADNTAPTAATTFSKLVNWIAVGT